MKKRILASLLSLCLLLGLLPTAALAEGTTPEAATTLSDNTSVDSTEDVTRAQLAEMIYANEKLKGDIDSMAGGNADPNFSDISSCTEAQQTAIKKLYQAKIISGTGESTFNPSGTVTRGEAVAVIWRAAGSRSNKTAMTQTFSDLNNQFYAPAVNCFYGAGMLSGTSEGQFDGDTNIPVKQVNAFLNAYTTNYQTFIQNTDSGATTRAEMTVEFYKKFQPELSRLAATKTGEMPFTDLSGCTGEQIEAIQFFYERDIINGTSETTFHPHTPVSNFQIAALLQRCATKEISAETPETFSLFSAAPLADQTPFEFLSSQGLDVTAAQSNPNAPALTTTLTTWRDGLAPSVPTFSPTNGTTFTETQAVTISAGSGDEGAVIYYTLDGSEPTTSGTPYSEAITITDTATVKAIAVKNNLISEVATATYTKQTQEPEQPALSISPSATSFNGSGTITLTTNKTADGVACSDSNITVTGSGTTWTATLPNASATYTFTATAGEETATCTVTVTYQSSGSTGGSSSGGSSSSGVSGVTGFGDDVNISAGGGSVTSAQMDKAVDRADRGGAITVDVGRSNTASLPTSGLENAAGNDNSLTVELRHGEVSLSPEALASVVEQAGRTAVITVKPVDTDDLNSRQQAAIGNAPVFDLTIKSGSKTISDFDGGLITVSLPYELPEGQDPAGVVVWFLDDNGNITPCETMYDLRSETVIFTTRHFSKYVIGYEEPMAFTDVAEGAYYYDAVAWAVKNGVTSGTSDTTFGPDISCTRAQMVTFLWRANGSPVVNYAMTFTDVPVNAYYAEAVRWAVSEGITGGTSATTFSPDTTCTRGQMATFLYRANGSPAVTSGETFSDVAADAYYADAVTWAANEGITAGTGNGQFSPDAPCTRAQIVTFLFRDSGE